MSDQQLRSEIRMLGEMLGVVLREQAGQDAFDLVEEIRTLAKARRRGGRDADRKIAERIASLDLTQIESLIQSLSVFFDLANLAEERHRVRVIRKRQEREPAPGIESVHDVLSLLRTKGVTSQQVQDLLHRLTIEFVFTAHPTEAKRRSIREKIREMRSLLYAMDNRDAPPRERIGLLQRIKAELTGIWQTDFVRFRRPSVLEELDRSLFFASNLWDVTPRLYRALSDGLREHYPDHSFTLPPLLRFGTWIGGDRDGHPHVTADVTRQALLTLRRDAIERHIKQTRITRRNLSMSSRKVAVHDDLLRNFNSALERWPALRQIVSHLSEHEPYRRWLRVVQWRLEQSLQADLTAELPDGAYAASEQFADDLRLIRRSLAQSQGERISRAFLDDWICQADVFGFHLMRMDVRQESSQYHQVIDELLTHAGVTGYAAMDEAARQHVLSTPPPAIDFDSEAMSEIAQETLALFELLARVARMSGQTSLGAHIISMTHNPSDVLAVLWLSRWAATKHGLSDGRLPMPIAPLFETINDLKNSSATLQAILRNETFADHVRQTGGKQIVMIGYSDSTKDGGYLAACWQLHKAQIAMQQVASELNIQLFFFHGRGGSLGRGGGPAARSITSLPPNTLAAGLRMTEQGEVLSERYDDPHIARRHLEQVLCAALASSAGVIDYAAADARHDLLETMSTRSQQAYRELVDHSGFIDYFEQATPITQIEQLPIGSRPARRASHRTLTTLRAIPWVFSWTQCRHMIPAWYGLGTALKEVMDNDGELRLQQLMKHDRFFRATIDNACLALAKADIGIAEIHASLMETEATRQEIWSRISREFQQTRQALLRLTAKRHLLADIPWLKRSIEVRNPYVDPLNFIQVELFRRYRAMSHDSPDAAHIAHLIRLSIQGIAGGLRTTG